MFGNMDAGFLEAWKPAKSDAETEPRVIDCLALLGCLGLLGLPSSLKLRDLRTQFCFASVARLAYLALGYQGLAIGGSALRWAWLGGLLAFKFEANCHACLCVRRSERSRFRTILVCPRGE